MNSQNWFLDMCIMISYAKNNPYSEISKKVLDFVYNKKTSSFLVCYYILEINLPKWINRQKVIIKEIKRKINNPRYIIGESSEGKLLFQKDKNECQKIFLAYLSSEKKEDFCEKIETSQKVIERRLKYLIENLVDKKVIPVSEIDFELKSSLFTYLNNNDSDAKTIASAVQQHNKEPLIIITSDRKHWTKELLEDSISIRPTLRKKYPKIPEINYIQKL
jgi:hypothetical protein